ncbi:MAG: hypothetical protein PHQ98_01940 [Candidatus ainarchaeum sp.]|nr:hypothetical protein [Candidatus ainarchaeum sp.]
MSSVRRKQVTKILKKKYPVARLGAGKSEPKQSNVYRYNSQNELYGRRIDTMTNKPFSVQPIEINVTKNGKQQYIYPQKQPTVNVRLKRIGPVK